LGAVNVDFKTGGNRPSRGQIFIWAKGASLRTAKGVLAKDSPRGRTVNTPPHIGVRGTFNIHPGVLQFGEPTIWLALGCKEEAPSLTEILPFNEACSPRRKFLGGQRPPLLRATEDNFLPGGDCGFSLRGEQIHPLLCVPTKGL